jgi:hypothetical protein
MTFAGFATPRCTSALLCERCDSKSLVSVITLRAFGERGARFDVDAVQAILARGVSDGEPLASSVYPRRPFGGPSRAGDRPDCVRIVSSVAARSGLIAEAQDAVQRAPEPVVFGACHRGTVRVAARSGRDATILEEIRLRVAT